ncbi:hypothetical protein [Kineococcus rhizosphaerae]|uniref:Uncharacterized protein n=1 Tax=Kineococcus rhizosphaerae TaxID=559628 RepID=A0A2T0R1F5_9ACTN|nr:hypothetical protein [Kineococcus rhizosphaerae]PRY13353.1 hypothetical protein CLV37_10821 [Kineococcus rhizosphaerae]
MSAVLATYAGYVVLSVALTLWVARTLFRNGALFLVEVFEGDEKLAAAVNHLLVVGFLLVNLGFVAYALQVDGSVPDARAAVEALSRKFGAVLLVVGAVHFTNLFVLQRMRRHARAVHRRPGPAFAPVVPPAPGYRPAPPR